jgi:hypothetical protein
MAILHKLSSGLMSIFRGRKRSSLEAIPDRSSSEEANNDLKILYVGPGLSGQHENLRYWSEQFHTPAIGTTLRQLPSTTLRFRLSDVLPTASSTAGPVCSAPESAFLRVDFVLTRRNSTKKTRFKPPESRTFPQPLT